MDTNDGDVSVPPIYDGLIFRSTGNYGSTIFDPLPRSRFVDSEFLQIAICDECIKNNLHLVAIFMALKK